jgi:hypothetical protein
MVKHNHFNPLNKQINNKPLCNTYSDLYTIRTNCLYIPINSRVPFSTGKLNSWYLWQCASGIHDLFFRSTPADTVSANCS